MWEIHTSHFHIACSWCRQRNGIFDSWMPVSSHHLDDFRYKASGVLLLCLALGFLCSRRQLLNVCTLGIHHPCMDWAPKHRMELQRHQQIFQNMNRSQTCKTWIQFSTTHSNVWEENTECYIHSARRNIQKSRPHHHCQDEKEWEKQHGFHRCNSILGVREWRQREEVARKRQFVPYRNTLQNQTGTKTLKRD